MSRRFNGKAMERIVTQAQIHRTQPRTFDQKTKQTTHTGLTNARDIVNEQHSVDKEYLGRLIGKGGSNLKQLKAETNTNIYVNNETGAITIKGAKDCVRLAKAAIDKVTKNTKTKQERPTHFLSLPVHSTLFHQRVRELNKFCMNTEINPDTLVSTANLHITLGVMKLSNRLEVDKAVNFLKEECQAIVHEVVGDNTLAVKLDKLQVMQPKPITTRVLYIEPKDGKGLFNNFCNSIIERMISEGLLMKEKRPFMPHVTLINTSHSKDARPFDATLILKKFNKLDFGTVTLNELHLMKMGRTGPNRTYESKGFISLTAK